MSTTAIDRAGSPGSARLVVVLPALNEARTIQSVLGRIPLEIRGVAAVEKIVVDDGSTDDTSVLAREAGAAVVRHAVNRGVGAAFATGIEAALAGGADIIVTMDSDGQFRPEDIPALIRPILDEGYGFVTCTRFGRPELVPDMPGIKLWGNRMVCRLVNWAVGGGRFTDVSCGFRALSRDAALRLNLFGKFTYTHETIIFLSSKGVATTEVGLVVRGTREHGTSRVASNLRRYAFQALWIILMAVRDSRPLYMFGLLGLATFATGLLLGLSVFAWWVYSGRTSPYRSVLTGSGAALMLGALLLVLALLADLVGRVRATLDSIYYYERARHYGAAGRGAETPQGDGHMPPASAPDAVAAGSVQPELAASIWERGLGSGRGATR